MEVESKYLKNREAMERWRKKNQEYVNKYYREKRAIQRAIKLEERNKQIALDYISNLIKK